MRYVVAGYGQYRWHLWNPVGDAAMAATVSYILCVCLIVLYCCDNVHSVSLLAVQMLG